MNQFRHSVARRVGRPAAMAALACALGAAPAAFAADNFGYSLSVNGGAAVSQGFQTAEDFLNGFDRAAIERLVSTYNEATDSAAFTASFRGIPVNLAFPTVGSTLLTFNVPTLGISQSFTGATRDASQQLLEDFLKTNGQDILSRILKEAAKVSPNDPIAGNPASMMGGMVANGYDASFTSQASQIISGVPQPGDRSNQLGLGLRFGSYKTGDVNTQTTTIPLSYTVRFDGDPRKQIVINLPFTYGTTEGAKLMNFAPSVSLRLPMNDRWTLTPTVSYGVTGSVDLASVAQMASVAVTSVYTIPVGDWAVSIGNMIGHYKTLKISIGDFSSDPDIANTVYRNGVLVSQPVTFLGGDKILEYSWVDTRYTGTALYMKWYDEIGLTLGTARGRDGLKSYFRAGVSYLYSAGSNGYALKFGYWF